MAIRVNHLFLHYFHPVQIFFFFSYLSFSDEVMMQYVINVHLLCTECILLHINCHMHSACNV